VLAVGAAAHGGQLVAEAGHDAGQMRVPREVNHLLDHVIGIPRHGADQGGRQRFIGQRFKIKLEEVVFIKVGCVFVG